MLFSPIVILQLYCAYQIYTNRHEPYWYFIVFFLPLIGSLIFLYATVIRSMNVDDVTNTIKDAFSEDPELDRLKKELSFADTMKNRLNLANAFLVRGNGEWAEKEYKSCLVGAYSDDASILIKLLHALHIQDKHKEAVDVGGKLTTDPLFKKSKERISYAISLGRLGKNNEAIKEFNSMNTRYSNYEHRLAYVQFLKSVDDTNGAKSLLESLGTEVDQMNGNEKRTNREVIKRIKVEVKA